MSEDHAIDQAFAHAASIGAIVGSVMGYLPSIAAIVAFAWYCIQIYESHTVQAFLKHRRERRAARIAEKLEEDNL